MGKYFGTDGIRGKANEALTPELALKVGQYLGYKFKNQKLIVGKDTRLSSSMLEHAIAAGAASMGADVYLLGLCATPALAYVLRTEGFAAGVMISASHNPYEDNGLKCFNSDGMKINEELESEIESFIEGQLEIDYAHAEGLGEIYDYAEGLQIYLNYVESCVEHRFDNFKIVLDLANGSAVSSAEKAFKDLGAEVVIMHNEPNGININKDAGSTHIDALKNRVLEEQADMGFAFDGDADRCLAVDHLGNVVDGDKILYLLGNELSRLDRLHHDTVVSTVMANLGFLKSMKSKGLKTIQTDVGDKNVFKEMVTNNYQLGGEQSGHIIIYEYSTTGDGVLTALKCAETVCKHQTSLFALTEDCMEFPQILKNVRVTSKEEIMNHESIDKKIAEITEVLGDNGRILVRPSGTEPLVRVMVEAETLEICDRYVEEMIAVIHEIKM